MSKDKKITHTPLSDMESDGVYFPEEVKKELTDLREKEHCHYSGLPSLWWYMNVPEPDDELNKQ